MSELEEHPISAVHGSASFELSLWRMINPGKTPVLLLHGASANHGTFFYPPGTAAESDEALCLARWLHQRGFEPWLLDWRGNGIFKGEILNEFRGLLDFDGAAEIDIPAALDEIRGKTGEERICAVGHCMGAATLAQAIAGGHLDDFQMTHVVLLAIGLFYEPAMGGRLRSLDKPLDGLWATRKELVAVDPRPAVRWPNESWPAEINELYENWPANLRPHPKPASLMEEMCNRVSFMFGQPYREGNLHEAVHDGDFLKGQFGAIPLRMYLQGARNVSRGWAGRFDARITDDELIGSEARNRFKALRRVTLITGAKNDIWQRDSIDRMYEWLGGGNCEKHVLPNYAHQDLLWGREAYKDVFPTIEAGLPEREVVRSSPSRVPG